GRGSSPRSILRTESWRDGRDSGEPPRLPAISCFTRSSGTHASGSSDTFAVASILMIASPPCCITEKLLLTQPQPPLPRPCKFDRVSDIGMAGALTDLIQNTRL